jgi:hypothetical protein
MLTERSKVPSDKKKDIFSRQKSRRCALGGGASSISFCRVLIKNLLRRQPTLPGTETIPLICSQFYLSVRMVSAPGVVWSADGAVL